MIQQNHVVFTYGGVAYSLNIDPLSYSEVDIVDFAPRAVSGTPAFAELGLYIDTAQSRFSHGFGKWRFDEEASYAFTGQHVDARHGFLTLFTALTQVDATSSRKVYDMALHKGVMCGAASDGVFVISAGAAVLCTDTAARDLFSNGVYLFIARSGRMQVADLGTATGGSSTTLVCTGAGWTVNLFDTNGKCTIYAGTGAGQTRAVSSNTVDTLTVAAWATQPDVTSKFFVWADAGVDANPPNDVLTFATFGGYVWMAEATQPWIHYFAENDGTDAECGQATDTSGIRIGPGKVALTNLCPFSNQLLAFRQDGVWSKGDDDVAYHMLDFAEQISALNFQTVAVWNGFAHFPVRNVLYKYKSGLQDATPPVWNEVLPYKQFGNFKCLTPRGKFLYMVGQSNAANSDESTQAAGFWSVLVTDGVGWHKPVDVPLTAPTDVGLWLDPVSDILYLFGYQPSDSKGYLYSIQLQTLSDLPYASYPTSGNHRWYSSFYDAGMRRINKSYATLTLQCDFPANTSVVASFRTTNGAAWTSLGTFTSDMQSVDFPTDTEGKTVQVRLDLQTTNSANTPVVKAVILKFMMRPDVLFSATFDVNIDENLMRPDGGMIGLTSEEARQAVRGARARVSPITFTDLWGSNWSAYLSSARFITIGYGDGKVVNVARCTVVRVKTS